jgi:hypothetical protein
LKEEKYQEALDKWGEVRAIDQQYPDRQWVQRTAKKELAKQAKPIVAKPKFVMPRSLWIGLGGIGAIAVLVFAINQFGNGENKASVTSTNVPTEVVVRTTDTLVPTATNSPQKTNTPRSASPIPPTRGPTDPTMADEFDNPIYDGAYDSTKWGNLHDMTSSSKIAQEDGLLVLQQRGPEKGFGFAALSLNSNSPLPPNKYSYLEIKMMIDKTNNKGGIGFDFFTNKTYFGCGLDGSGGEVKKNCFTEDLPYYQNTTSIFRYSGVDDKWYVFKVKIDPFERTIIFYIDGQIIASYPLASNETLPKGFGLGCYIAQDNDFRGYVDYVKIYTSNE